MKNCFLILFRIAVDRGSIGNDVITVFNILFEEFLYSTLTYILGVCHLEQTDSFRSPLRKRNPLYHQSPAPSFSAILTSATRPITVPLHSCQQIVPVGWGLYIAGLSLISMPSWLLKLLALTSPFYCKQWIRTPFSYSL